MNGIKINIEIGHESSLKAKPTPENFTHDWQLFVRGCDQNDISHYVDKVVFNLHDTFPKPKRTIKEPPYVLKESGYAGFELNIDIYVKNRDEPKKISFQYDMDLQQSGPSICRTQTFTHTFINPSEEFARKLKKGGGVSVYNTSMVNNFDEKSRDRSSSAMSNNGDGAKGSSSSSGAVSSGKHKSREQPASDFTNVFGTPITKTNSSSASSLKVSPDPKAHRKTSPNRAATSSSSASNSAKGSTSSSTGGKGEKGSATNATSSGSSSSSGKDKSSSSSRSRHTSDSPHVDRGDKYDRREGDKGKRERNRSRERGDSGKGSSSSGSSKDKSQKRRASSPKYNSPGGGSNLTSNPPSSKSRSPQRNSSDYQGGSKGSAPPSTGGKSLVESGSKKSSKKEKKEKSHDKERSATTSAPEAQSRDQGKKDRDSSGSGKRESSKFSGSKEVTNSNNSNHSSRSEEKFSASGGKKEEKQQRTSGHDRDSSTGASGSSPADSAKKHKHKKKDKEKSGSGSGKGGSKDQERGVNSPAVSQFPKGAVTPPNAQIGGSKEKKAKGEKSAKESFTNSPLGGGQVKSGVSSSEKSQDAYSYNHKAGSHSNLSDSDESEQLAEPLQNEEATGLGKAGSKSKKSEKSEKKNKRKLKEELSDGQVNSPNKMEPPLKLPRKQAPPSDDGYLSKNGTDSLENNNSYHGSNNHPRLAEPEYIQELKALQYKIMNLQDSNDLQQVVEIIAVTGMYEITDATKTFDFDLCDLPPETLKTLTALLNRFSS